MAIGQIEQGEPTSTAACSTSVQRTKIFGGKRVVASHSMDSSFSHSLARKRRIARPRIERPDFLGSLPKDILVKILFKVNRSDLRQLLLVSRSVSEATLIAGKLHHVFSTPSPKLAFKDCCEATEECDEAPNAPKRHKVAKSRIGDKNLASIAVALFVSSDDRWSSKDESVEEV